MDSVVNRVRLGDREVGEGLACFVIAEAGVNHNGDLEMARRLMRVAAESGADAVKFQTYRTDELVTAAAPKAAYQLLTTDHAESQFEMLRRLELSQAVHERLFNESRELGIMFMSTVFDMESADFLERLGVACFKIPSGEITNEPLLAHVASKGLPLILSTGMATLGEVERSLEVIRGNGDASVILLHCVSSYPAPPEGINLRAIKTLRHAFGIPVGYSDHTMGIEVAVAAVASGACIIEKHFTLDRRLNGPDHQASLESEDLRRMCDGIRVVERALGDGRKRPTSAERSAAAVARRSLVASADIPAGTVVSEDMLALKRPGMGLAWAMRAYVVGRRTIRDIDAGTVLSLDMLQ